MNKTQKGAMVNLIAMLLNIAVLVFLFIEMFVLKRFFESFWEKLWVPVSIPIILAGLMIFYYRKQSSVEVESDERDRLIKYRAVIASFVSVWILLAVVTIIPRFVVGIKGSIPVWLLTFINLGVLLGALLVYSVAVLVQYGWRGQRWRKVK